MSEFDVNGYNSHECDIHNHGYYLGAQSQQSKIDELQARIDKVICRLDKGICHVGSEALFNILTGNKDENY